MLVQVMPDDHSKSVPPLPIPNRTVKRLCADDSAATSVKVGYRQASYKRKPARSDSHCESSPERAFLRSRTDMENLRISSEFAEMDLQLIHRFLANESYWAKDVQFETV